MRNRREAGSTPRRVTAPGEPSAVRGTADVVTGAAPATSSKASDPTLGRIR